MANDQVYSAIFVSGRLTVAIRELLATGDERKLELRVDGSPRGELSFRAWYLPRMAIGNGELLLWGGPRAYFLGLAGGPLHRFDFEDEIHGAYRLAAFWCLVCETSVVLWTPEEGVSLSECHHDEVLLGSWWEGGRLIVEDLQNRRFEVEVDEKDLRVALRSREVEESPSASAVGPNIKPVRRKI